MMPVGLFDSIASILNDQRQSSKDFFQAIVIFLSNVGGEEITITLDRMISQGTPREHTKIQDFENISKASAQNAEGELKNFSLITSSVIDHVIPFLPLERRHIARCVQAEFRKLKREPKEEDIR